MDELVQILVSEFLHYTFHRQQKGCEPLAMSTEGSKNSASLTTSPVKGVEARDASFRQARRGVQDEDASSPSQVDEQTAARTLLTADEEKKLLRRIDWHLMPLCSLMFLFKNLDSDNVSPLTTCK